MKILRFVLVVGGIALIGYSIYSTFDVSKTESMVWTGGKISNQLIGMLGIGILAILAGAFMKRRR